MPDTVGILSYVRDGYIQGPGERQGYQEGEGCRRSDYVALLKGRITVTMDPEFAADQDSCHARRNRWR